MKEDSMLLMRGFDSVAHTLSLLSNNLDNALQVCLQLLIWTKRVSFNYHVICAKYPLIFSTTNIYWSVLNIRCYSKRFESNFNQTNLMLIGLESSEIAF